MAGWDNGARGVDPGARRGADAVVRAGVERAGARGAPQRPIRSTGGPITLTWEVYRDTLIEQAEQRRPAPRGRAVPGKPTAL